MINQNATYSDFRNFLIKSDCLYYLAISRNHLVLSKILTCYPNFLVETIKTFAATFGVATKIKARKFIDVLIEHLPVQLTDVMLEAPLSELINNHLYSSAIKLLESRPNIFRLPSTYIQLIQDAKISDEFIISFCNTKNLPFYDNVLNPLTAAIASNREKIIKFYIEHPVLLRTISALGQGAAVWDLIKNRRQDLALQVFVSHPKVCIRFEFKKIREIKNTPLHDLLALEEPSIELFRYISKCDIRLYFENQMNESLIDIALKQKHFSILNYLLDQRIAEFKYDQVHRVCDLLLSLEVAEFRDYPLAKIIVFYLERNLNDYLIQLCNRIKVLDPNFLSGFFCGLVTTGRLVLAEKFLSLYEQVQYIQVVTLELINKVCNSINPLPRLIHLLCKDNSFIVNSIGIRGARLELAIRNRNNVLKNIILNDAELLCKYDDRQLSVTLFFLAIYHEYENINKVLSIRPDILTYNCFVHGKGNNIIHLVLSNPAAPADLVLKLCHESSYLMIMNAKGQTPLDLSLTHRRFDATVVIINRIINEHVCEEVIENAKSAFLLLLHHPASNVKQLNTILNCISQYLKPKDDYLINLAINNRFLLNRIYLQSLDLKFLISYQTIFLGKATAMIINHTETFIKQMIHPEHVIIFINNLDKLRARISSFNPSSGFFSNKVSGTWRGSSVSSYWLQIIIAAKEHILKILKQDNRHVLTNTIVKFMKEKVGDKGDYSAKIQLSESTQSLEFKSDNAFAL